MTLTEQREQRALVRNGAANANANAIEQVLIRGDLKALTPEQRNAYYMRLCEMTGLNPLTQPFEYLTLNGRLVLYAKKACTDQLRAIHDISVVDMDEEERRGVVIVTVKVANAKGRTDMGKGACNVDGLKGDALANAFMKAETKAKRRATLSICGLGILDEIELETIPGATPPASSEAAGGESPEAPTQPRQRRRVNVQVNPATGHTRDLENARNQRPEWDRFTDKVKGYIDARDAEGLRLWFTGDAMAAYVAGWVFGEQAEEHFEKAIDEIAARIREDRDAS